MLDDILSTIGASDANFSKSLAQTSSELGLDIRNDLASTLGGELALALDGPVLPTPSWKMVVEVNNPGALQVAIDKLVQAINREAQKLNDPETARFAAYFRTVGAPPADGSRRQTERILCLWGKRSHRSGQQRQAL